MKQEFQFASASIRGTEHVQRQKNNQDALVIRQAELFAIGIVCDGCGSGVHSEIGAQLGACLISQYLKSVVEKGNLISDPLDFVLFQKILDETTDFILNQIQILSQFMGEAKNETILENFLFTNLGFLLTPKSLATFRAGDGVVVLNGEIEHFGPFPENQPPYLAYRLFDPKAMGLSVHKIFPIDEIQSVIIGTDGFHDLEKAMDKPLPGKTELFGPISQFFEKDVYFENPDALRRRLTLANKSHSKPDWEKRRIVNYEGLLPDDTTLIVARRLSKATSGNVNK